MAQPLNSRSVSAARDVLNAFLGTEEARGTDLEPIHGGQSAARLYQFNHEGRTCVLRVLAPRSSPDRHHHEVRLTRAAGDVGVGPRVHFVADDESAIIYDYTPGRALRLEDLHQASVLQRLAQRLSQLHRCSADVPEATSPFERFYGFEQLAVERGHPWPQAMARAAAYVRQVDEQLQHTALCPCHLDLHARNIILTPKGDPVLIDWVNGGASDPAFDLATAIAFLGLHGEQRHRFLANYQDSMGEAPDLARVGTLLPIRPFVAAASSLVATPVEVTPSQLEEEWAREERPGYELHSLPPCDRPSWPTWKWGLVWLKMGLSHLP